MGNFEFSDLERLNRTELIKAWFKAFNSRPPKRSSRSFLITNLAYRAQEQAYGELRPKTRKRLTTIAIALERDPTYSLELSNGIKPGTRLIRRWKGDIHEVTVLEDGFDYCGHYYRSLSGIAREITGTRWSGPLFFGLKKTGEQKGSSHA